MEVLQDSEFMVSSGRMSETQILRVLTFCLKRVVLELYMQTMSTLAA